MRLGPKTGRGRLLSRRSGYEPHEEEVEETTMPTSPQRGSKSSFSIALICATRRRIPVGGITNQGRERGIQSIDSNKGNLFDLKKVVDVYLLIIITYNHLYLLY